MEIQDSFSFLIDMKYTLPLALFALVVFGAGCSPTSSENTDVMMRDNGTQETQMMQSASGTTDAMDAMKTSSTDAMIKDKNSESQDDRMMKSDDAMKKDDDTMMKKEDDGAMKKDDSMKNDESAMKAEANISAYTNYSPELAKKLATQGKKVVLFFHAPWCPYCRAAEQAFTTNMKNIPGNAVVLKVDYDSSTELQKMYGVTTQHTFVQIDANGKQITKWIGGDIKELAANIK